MLKSAMSSDPAIDISAFKHILAKFCTGGFRYDTSHLFCLAWLFAFVKNHRGDVMPVQGKFWAKLAERPLPLTIKFPGKRKAVDFNMG